ANLVLGSLGLEPRMLLMGSSWALVLAYVLRFAIIAAGGTEAGLARIPPSLDQAARGLGDSPGTMLWRVHLPLLRPALAAGAAPGAAAAGAGGGAAAGVRRCD